MRITNKEIIIGISGFVVALAIVGGGLWWHARSNQKKIEASQVDSQQDQSSDNGSSLSVSTGQASSLGQLNNGDGQAQGSGGNSGSGSGGNSDGVNPADFSQYDKYQSNKHALFGDIQTGSGVAIKTGQKANIIYKAWLTNGTLVDQSPVSSSGQSQPFGFTIGSHQAIAGLEEGVYGMNTGGKRLVIVPPAVGYGSKGKGLVPANAVIIFEVQLVSIQ